MKPSSFSTRYLALLRGINVGGNNIIKMADLRRCFEKNGYKNVVTYIQSGNVLFDAEEKNVKKLETNIEALLSKTFNYQSRIVLLTEKHIKETVQHAPSGFGIEKEKYKYDVVFLKEPLTPAQAIKQVPLKEGVDKAYAGKHAIFFSRLISKASQSRLAKIITLPMYKNSTIRNWNTTVKLSELTDQK